MSPQPPDHRASEPPPATLRRAVPADAALVATLGRRTFSDAFAHLNPPGPFAAYLDLAFDETRIEGELRDPRATFLLAEFRDADRAGAYRAGELFGYCKLQREAANPCVPATRPIELQRIYVEQRYVGRRCGDVLMHAALEHARAGEHDWIWLCSWEENSQANRFYARHGFREVGERPFHLGDLVQRDLVLAREV